ncbi:MAG: hypothetical protein ACPGQN_05390 [Candidatus Poseidoniaceae archaeon]
MAGKEEYVSLNDELFSRKESNVAMSIFLGLLVLLTGVNMTQFSTSIYDDAIGARVGDLWLVEFDLTTTTYATTELLQDEEVVVLEFDPRQIGTPEELGLGMIEIRIEPEESAGTNPSDPFGQCDSIAATLQQNDFSAQWGDERNVISGQDSSCEAIDLSLIVYPGFTGNSSTVTVANEFQALMSWSDTSWGDGIIELVLELDTNYIQELGVITEDSDEELTVTVTFTSFEAKASLLNE